MRQTARVLPSLAATSSSARMMSRWRGRDDARSASCRARVRPRACRSRSGILRRELAAGGGAQIRIHVAGADRAHACALVDVLEERLPGKLLALAHAPREPSVRELDDLLHAALRAKRSVRRLPWTSACRSRSVVDRTIRSRAGPVVPNPNHAVLEDSRTVASSQGRESDACRDQRRSAGEPPAARGRTPAAGRIWRHRGPSTSAGDTELFAAAGVAAGHLQVRPRIARNPHVAPGRRND